ncbi:MAG: fatty acid amide hydrolase 2, partial [Myxococcota bacterium]
MKSVLDASVEELAARVRARELSVLDLVDAHIERIEAVNGALTAAVGQRFEAARREALAAEARLANAPRGAPLPPLLGVPFTAQEAAGVSGLPSTGGSVYRWDDAAEQDCIAVARLRVAGAIPIAVTNLPEGGLWLESNNLIYGRTNNPWSRHHTAGGACGGEAALIAAGGSPLGLGSGLLSAVTVPAAFCGVAAYQPTDAWAPRADGFSPSHLGCGLLARRCSDLHLLGPLLTGRPPLDG